MTETARRVPILASTPTPIDDTNFPLMRSTQMHLPVSQGSGAAVPVDKIIKADQLNRYYRRKPHR